MATYKIGEKKYEEDAPELQEALAAIYGSDVRPLCMCVPKGVEMYISRFSNYVVKRMPDSGQLHDPACDSFEVPDADTGRGLHAGDAILRMDDGRLRIRLGFPLTRYEGKSVPHGVGDGSSDAVAGGKGSLTIGALLHLLWHEAGIQQVVAKDAGQALLGPDAALPAAGGQRHRRQGWPAGRPPADPGVVPQGEEG